MDMLGRVVTDRVSLFLEKTVFGIDPATEYLYYDSRMSKLLDCSGVPDAMRDYVRELLRKKGQMNSRDYNSLKTKLHRDFWDRTVSEHALRNTLVRKIFQHATRLGADFLIPPVPLMVEDGFFDITTKINELSKEVALALGRKDCANYFLLTTHTLRNPQLLRKIKEFIMFSSVHLNIIKFKHLDLTHPEMVEERENYRELLLDLAYFSKNFKNRCFVVLENYYQSFPSAVAGFDIVSGSITGYDKDGGRSKTPSYGKWIDPKLMVPLEFDGVRRMFRNNGGRLPCHHDVCRTITNINEVPQARWNALRRQHCSLYYNDLMVQIARAVKERNVEFAREKLSGSQLSTLRALVPTPNQM
jgi:hypothetical protein